MITGKRFLSLLLLLALSMTLLFSSCAKTPGDSEESDKALSILLEVIESDERRAETDCYVVVIHERCLNQLAERARVLSDGIEKITGIESVVEYDGGDNPIRDNAIEIILGKTERNESKIALAELRAKDYVCRKIDGNIFIGGVTDTATIEAVDRFIDEILPYASAEQLMSSGAEFSHFGEYLLDDVKLCGFSVEDFDIVGEPSAMAELLCAHIRNDSGYVLDIGAEPREGIREIVVEVVEGDEYVDEAYVLYDGEDVILRAYDEYSLELLVERFKDILISEPTDEICLVDTWSTRAIKCPNKIFAIEHIAIDDSDEMFDLLGCVSSVFERINGRRADVIFISDVSLSNWNVIKLNLPSGYTYRTVGEERVSAVIYDPDGIKLSVDSVNRDGTVQIDVSFAESDEAPEYNITYLYSDERLSTSDASAEINRVIASGAADMVVAEFDIFSEEDSLSTDGLIENCEHMANGRRVYIDFLNASEELEIIGASSESLKNGEGAPFGFLCRTAQVSFRRAPSID